MIGIKKYFLILSLIFYVTACSPPTREVSNINETRNSNYELSTKYINKDGLYKFDLPNNWLDVSDPNVSDFVNSSPAIDKDNELTKQFLNTIEAYELEGNIGVRSFMPFDVLYLLYIDDVKEYGFPWVNITNTADTYKELTDAELEAYCLWKEQYFKSVAANPDFEMERCGGSNVLRGKGQQFTKLLNNPYNDYEQYIYTTFMYDDLAHSIIYTCHKEVCDIFFPQVSGILSSFDKYP